MSTEYHKLLISPAADKTRKALDYLDGKQEPWVIQALNATGIGRKDWQTKGMQPRFRNLTKMIIEKSGLLFNEAPRLAVYSGEVVDDVASAALLELMEEADWLEFFANVDSVVRLLKTVIVLIQATPDEELVMDCLHQGNSYVVIDPVTRKMDMLVYRMTGECDGEQDIRVYTNVSIDDYHVAANGLETLVSSVPNPDGIIPAVVFHDTNIPRVGFWNFMPHDLVTINEIYNFHLIDSEYCASWVKNPTLFTNATINGGQGAQGVEQQWFQGVQLPMMAATNQNTIGGGPGAIVTLTNDGGVQPFVEYIGPVVDLQPIDTMVGKWVSDYASDWSVNVKSSGTSSGGSGKANSGFQLIVEEADNLQLRKKRSQMFVAGFRRMFLVLQTVFGLPGESLFAVFPTPELPVDELEDEQVWGLRLTDGRASLVTYFMAKEGLTREEAVDMVLQIQEDNKLVPADATTIVPSNIVDTSDEENTITSDEVKQSAFDNPGAPREIDVP